tara:strand:+ start:93 stop:278 length:186 start_codon:yes stop_codon:yes gene_type:complete
MTDYRARSPEELKCIEYMKILLKVDTDALFRILQVMKMEIYKEEAKKQAAVVINKAKENKC